MQLIWTTKNYCFKDEMDKDFDLLMSKKLMEKKLELEILNSL